MGAGMLARERECEYNTCQLENLHVMMESVESILDAIER
jgi:hypothetical protein